MLDTLTKGKKSADHTTVQHFAFASISNVMSVTPRRMPSAEFPLTFFSICIHCRLHSTSIIPKVDFSLVLSGFYCPELSVFCFVFPQTHDPNDPQLICHLSFTDGYWLLPDLCFPLQVAHGDSAFFVLRSVWSRQSFCFLFVCFIHSSQHALFLQDQIFPLCTSHTDYHYLLNN